MELAASVQLAGMLFPADGLPPFSHLVMKKITSNYYEKYSTQSMTFISVKTV